MFAIVGYSLPTFWLGLLLMMFFYGFLGIFPPGDPVQRGQDVVYFAAGWQPVHRRCSRSTAILNWRWDIFVDALYHLVLPTINLVILDSALIMRLIRSSMLEALGQDYIRTALAKGADRRTVYVQHARRNGLLPVITISGVMFAGLLAGMVITETIFARKGIGWWMARAAIQLDVPAIMFNVLFLGVVFVVVNLVVDLIYAAVDPRIRLHLRTHEHGNQRRPGTGPARPSKTGSAHPRLKEFGLRPEEAVQEPAHDHRARRSSCSSSSCGLRPAAGARRPNPHNPYKMPHKGWKMDPSPPSAKAPLGTLPSAVRHPLRGDLGHPQRLPHRPAGGGRQRG